jgi:hypothetical protein
MILAKKIEEMRVMGENLSLYEYLRAEYDRGGMTLL